MLATHSLPEHYNCRCCLVPTHNDDAVDLADLARAIKAGRERLTRTDGLRESDIGVAALSLRFDMQPPEFKLRAMVEQWSRERIVRELY